MKWLMALAIAGTCMFRPAGRSAPLGRPLGRRVRSRTRIGIRSHRGRVRRRSQSDIECRSCWSDATDARHGGRVPSPKPIRR